MASSNLLSISTQRSTTQTPNPTSQNTVKRPWSLLHGTLSLSTITLSQQELTSELLSRLPQLRTPLTPFARREKSEEGKLKATVGGDKAKDAAAPGLAGKGLGAKGGGNPLLALATTNAAKEAAKADATTSPTDTKGKEKESADASSRLRTFATSEMDSTPSMIEDALLLSEEFGIDEVESYMLLRSMIWNKGVPMPVEVDNDKISSSNSFEKSITPGSSTFGAGGKAPTTTRTMKTYSADIDVRIPKDVLLPIFAEFLAEEVLAVTRSVTCLCIAWGDKDHPWNQVAATVLPKILEGEKDTGRANPSTSTTGASLPVFGEKDAMRYVEMLLKEYTVHTGLSDSEDEKEEKKDKSKETTTPAAALQLFKSASLIKAKESATTNTAGYRSHNISQILLEQHATLELLFWFLWQAFIPWSNVALPILKVAYRCDLGLKLNAPTSGAKGTAKGGLGAFIYLEEKDKSVLKSVEMMWMLLCVSVFDIAHLLTQLEVGNISLTPTRDVSMAIAGPGENTESDVSRREETYTHIYDARLLPQLFDLLSSTPPNNPRYSPILLAWAFVLSCVSQAAVEVGEALPKEYIPFMQMIIPEFSVDTIGDRTSEVDGWMSSLITGFAVGELGVLTYLDACLKGDTGEDGDKMSSSGVFTGEEHGQGIAFGPPIYRVVVKRLLLCLPSLLQVSLLPPQHLTAYLELFITLFGYGPSLPELAQDYWSHDIVNETQRTVFVIATNTFPLAGSAYQLNGSLGNLVCLLRSLTGVGTWELQGGSDMSSMSNIPSGVASFSMERETNEILGGLSILDAARDAARRDSTRHVFHYLDTLDIFSMVLQQSGPMGFRNMWDTVVDTSSVYGGSNGGGSGSGGGMFYTNLHPFLLPGGSILPAKSRGKLLSGGSGKPLVVQWLHRYSGWSVLLEVLDECGKRLANPSAALGSAPNSALLAITQGPGHTTTPHLKRGGGRPVSFTLSSIGVDFASLDVENLVVEILDLFRSAIMHKDGASHIALFESMERSNDPILVEPMEDDRSNDHTPKRNLDLAQVIIQILSDALVRAGSKLGRFSGATNAKVTGQNLRLITSAISMLSALARVLPQRIWPLMRSTGLLGLAGGGFGFAATTTQHSYGGSNDTYIQPSTLPQSTTAAVLASERATGSYGITLSILSLVRSLLDNAIESDMSSEISPELKGEVLGNALRFVHANVWCEYSGWKYRRLGDRFEIGTRVTAIFCDVLRNWTAGPGGEGSSNGLVFRGVAAYVLDAFLFQAAPNTVTPLVHTLTIGQDMARALKGAQRNAENAQLTVLLQSYLLLSRLVLAYKRSSPFASRQSLLEHLLCTGTSINSNSVSSSRHPKVIPIDSIANLALSTDMGSSIPIYAVEMLSSLVLSFAEIQPSPPSLVTHMSDAEETVNQLVRIVSSNYEDSKLRKAIWGLMGNSVELQPALATLFVTGSFFVRPSVSEPRGDDKDKDKAQAASPSKSPSGTDRKTKSALTVAVETAALWEGLWKSDPALLSVIIRFVDAVWRHGLEHATALDTVRLDSSFWTRLIWIVKQGASSDDGMELDRAEKSRYDASIRSAYHRLTQAYAVDICAIEAGSQRRSTKSTPASTPVGGQSKAAPPAVSVMALKNLSQVGGTLAHQLKEAMKSSLDVDLHERLAHQLNHFFPDFSLEAIQSPFPAVQRNFGAEYLYQVTLMEPRLGPEMTDRETSNRLRQLLSDAQAVNCNWSIVDAEIEHTRAWKQFLQEGGASMQSDDKGKIELFKLSISMSETIAKETRKGKTMTIIHTERLGALLALLESTWSLSLSTNKDITKLFSKLLRNVHAIIMSDVFPPIESLRESASASGEGTGFHRHVLRIAYFCARKARTLFEKGQTTTAEQNAVVASAMLSITGLVSTALSEAIDAAKTQPNIEIDRDMELLVTVFEQSTRPELHTSPRLWLERVQELNLARSSLELLTKCDIGGDLMDGEVLRTYRHPLYARHMLAFQLCLASMEAPAETLAISGAISAYSSISIANDLTVGTLSAFHPELPGERSPGQQAWCNLLAIVTALVGTVGRVSNHFIETEITSFIQLYGAQISRALEWNIGQPLSSATLEELEAVMRLFNAISMGVNPRSAADIQAQGILQTFAEKGLTLIQHVNYALSHPNHFASLFEAITADERRALDREVGQTPSMGSVYELLDAEKRPFIASLTQRTHVIVRDILCTLVIVNQGDEVVTGEPEDWPTVVQVAPTTKVTVGELATMGTLLEMGNGIIDLLQHVKPSKDAARASMTYSTPTFDSSYDLSILSQSLESIAIFSVTQLAVWQHQITTGNSGMGDDLGMEWDDVGYGKEPALGRVGKRAAILPGLGGDVLNELLGMLSKAKVVLAKLGEAKDSSKTLMDLLEGFLNIRVMS